MDAETSRAIGALEGRLDGHDQEIGGLRDQCSRIEKGIGNVEGMLKRAIESGPHPVMTAPQPAVEPVTSSLVGNAFKLANKPVAIHALYLGVGLVVLLWILVATTNRSASDYLPGLKSESTRSRSGITLPPPDEKDAQ
jgi:hypothetical protein